MSISSNTPPTNTATDYKTLLKDVADSRGKGWFGTSGKCLVQDKNGNVVAEEIGFFKAVAHKVLPKKVFRNLVTVNVGISTKLIGALDEKEPQKRLGTRKSEVIYSKTVLKDVTQQKVKFLDADKCASMLEKITNDEKRAQSTKEAKDLKKTVDDLKKNNPILLENKKTDYKNNLLSLQTEINTIEKEYNKTLNNAGILTKFNGKLGNFKKEDTILSTVGVFDKITTEIPKQEKQISAVTLQEAEKTKTKNREALKKALEDVIKGKDGYLSWDINGRWGIFTRMQIKIFLVNLNSLIPNSIARAFQKLSTSSGIRNAMADGFKAAGFSDKDAVKYAEKPLDSERCKRLLSEMKAEDEHEKRLGDIAKLNKEESSLKTNFEDAKQQLEKANNEKVSEFTTKKESLQLQLQNLKDEIKTAEKTQQKQLEIEKQKQLKLEQEKKLKEENKVKFNETFTKLTQNFETEKKKYTVASASQEKGKDKLQDALIKLKEDIKTSVSEYNKMLKDNKKLLTDNKVFDKFERIEQSIESLKSLDTVTTLKNIEAPKNEFEGKEITDFEDATKKIQKSFEEQTKKLEEEYKKKLDKATSEQKTVKSQLRALKETIEFAKQPKEISITPPLFETGELSKE
jgi:hypothetical protein